MCVLKSWKIPLVFTYKMEIKSGLRSFSTGFPPKQKYRGNYAGWKTSLHCRRPFYILQDIKHLLFLTNQVPVVHPPIIVTKSKHLPHGVFTQVSTTECRWRRLFQATDEHPSRTWITCHGLWSPSVSTVFLQVKCLPLDSEILSGFTLSLL